MEIQEIKQRLTLATVLQHYGLKPDKNRRLCCPFHDDKTPSMQVYYNTHTVYCFSSNCKTHGKSLDVIDFVMYKENCTKHEALKKCEELIGGTAKPIPQSRAAFLQNMFSSFKNAVHSSPAAKAYLESRCLDYKQVEVGFNGGQFHHGTRRDETLIAQCIATGLLLDKNLISRTGEKGYSVFGKNCIVFPLKNQAGEIVSLYFRSTTNDKEQRHFYLRNRQGLYPCYPSAETKTLILTESIIDAATLLQHAESRKQNAESGDETKIPSAFLPSAFCLLALYGTNGLTEEHQQAIQKLKQLEEVIFFLNGDEPGRAATEKYSKMLKESYPHLKITVVPVPDGEDVNSLVQGHEPAILTHLIEKRKEFLFSTEKSEQVNEQTSEQEQATPNQQINNSTNQQQLNTSHPDCLLYRYQNICFTLWGGIDVFNVNRLRATLHIRLEENEYRSFRDTIDLYSHTQTERLIKQASEKLESSATVLTDAITALTAELEQYRNEKREAKRDEERTQDKSSKDIFSKEQMQASADLLKSKELNQLTHSIFGNLGLVGQQDNGMLLFFIFLTRLFKNPLHAIVMGSSGSGKTHLLQGVAQTIPKQHIHFTTSLSENTLYYTPKDFLKHKILLQEDLDGAYNALLPLRELMSNQSISRFSTKTNSRTGDSKQVYLQVEGPVCIAGATTKERIYEDNANRSFLIQIEDSPAQERAVLTYQGQVASGEINPKSYEKNINLLKAAQLQLEPLEVLIPFASELELPPFVFKKLRTKSHYLTLIKSVTLWNQKNRQRQTDEQGNTVLLSSVEDVKWANELCKESLLRKSDELTGKTRNFFESLKALQTKETEKTALFRAVEVRGELRLHPMQAKRYLDELTSRGLIRCKSKSQRFGNEYEIMIWNDYQLLQSGLNVLDEIVKKIEVSQGFTPASQKNM